MDRHIMVRIGACIISCEVLWKNSEKSDTKNSCYLEDIFDIIIKEFLIENISVKIIL